METKTIGFLETYNAKAGVIEKSNSRRVANIIIYTSLAFCAVILLTGCWIALSAKESISLIGIATTIGTLFTTTAGVAMGFLFFQKKTETKTDDK